jgi:predicted RNA-binding Zn ribbon-like protein
MKPLLLADHPALELLNTVVMSGGAPFVLIGDGRAFLDWLVEVGLVDAAEVTRLRKRFPAAALDRVAVEARKMRGWAADWLMRWRAAPEARYEPELRRLNELLARASDVRQVVRNDQGLAIAEHHRFDSVGELLGLLAAQIADLLVNEDPELVKRCEGAECILWFVDRTKAHRRRFCSAAVCGNRDKVAAFRARQRQSSKDRSLS